MTLPSKTARAHRQTSASVWSGGAGQRHPDDGVVDLRLQDNTLHNTGTLRVGIIGAEECTAAGTCTPHPVSHSLYPDAALTLPFQLQPGNSLQLRYRLTRDGYREHVRTIEPTAT